MNRYEYMKSEGFSDSDIRAAGVTIPVSPITEHPAPPVIDNSEEVVTLENLFEDAPPLRDTLTGGYFDDPNVISEKDREWIEDLDARYPSRQVTAKDILMSCCFPLIACWWAVRAMGIALWSLSPMSGNSQHQEY